MPSHNLFFIVCPAFGAIVPVVISWEQAITSVDPSEGLAGNIIEPEASGPVGSINASVVPLGIV